MTKILYLRHFSFALECWKLIFVMCVHFRNFGKSRSLKASLNIFSKVLKTPKKHLSGSKIMSYSLSEFQEHDRKAKHRKYIFEAFFFHRWVFSSRHFNFAFWSKNFILQHFNFAVELKNILGGILISHFCILISYLNGESANHSCRENFLP